MSPLGKPYIAQISQTLRSMPNDGRFPVAVLSTAVRVPSARIDDDVESDKTFVGSEISGDRTKCSIRKGQITAR